VGNGNWYTGTGKKISFNDIVEIVSKHSKQEGSIYVGSDSIKQKSECIFCTAICLLGETDQSNRYFIKREKDSIKNHKILIQRITTEVQNSIDIGLKLLYHCPSIKIELHIDVGNSGKGSKTSKFADMLVGYAEGNGFKCKTKPEAFAAYCVADRHSR